MTLNWAIRSMCMLASAISISCIQDRSLHESPSMRRYPAALIPQASPWQTAGTGIFPRDSKSNSCKTHRTHPALQNTGQAHLTQQPPDQQQVTKHLVPTLSHKKPSKERGGHGYAISSSAKCKTLSHSNLANMPASPGRQAFTTSHWWSRVCILRYIKSCHWRFERL